MEMNFFCGKEQPGNGSQCFGGFIGYSFQPKKIIKTRAMWILKLGLRPRKKQAPLMSYILMSVIRRMHTGTNTFLFLFIFWRPLSLLTVDVCIAMATESLLNILLPCCLSLAWLFVVIFLSLDGFIKHASINVSTPTLSLCHAGYFEVAFSDSGENNYNNKGSKHAFRRNWTWFHRDEDAK